MKAGYTLGSYQDAVKILKALLRPLIIQLALLGSLTPVRLRKVRNYSGRHLERRHVGAN